MDPLLILSETRGFFTRAEARGQGYDDKGITHAVRSGLWHRIRRGYYTFVHLWAPMSPAQRHLVRASAVQHHLGPAVALSHVTAALAHGLTTWGVSLDRVHVTRLDGGAGRVEGDVVHHVGVALSHDIIEVGGLRVMAADRAALETGTMGTPESALVTFDSFLCLEIGEHDTLMARFERMEHWPRTRHLHVPVRMADAGAQSAGETRGRWGFRQAGLPAPQTQYRVYDADGVLRGTTDWGWPGHRVLGEFDGKQKYTRLLLPSQDPGEVVFAEKQRERLLCELTGFVMVRAVWSDYDRPRLLAQRFARALRGSA